jgi:hypothetical protein
VLSEQVAAAAAAAATKLSKGGDGAVKAVATCIKKATCFPISHNVLPSPQGLGHVGLDFPQKHLKICDGVMVLWETRLMRFDPINCARAEPTEASGQV